MTITEQFLSNIEKVANKPIPDSAMKRAHRSLIDYIAVTTAGAKANQEKLKKYFAFAEPENGNSTLIGMGKISNLKEAVFLNGLNAHALDFDDGTNTGIIHLGSTLFSALIPLAEKYGIEKDKMLRAAIIGYETSFTMAVSIQPKHKVLGFHATGTCGVLGIAIAASYMLDFTDEERRNAFAIAGVSATGMLKVLDDESELKPYNVAKSALLGLTAVQMAKAGFIGHHDVLGGNRGYLKMMTGEENIEFKSPLLNGTYAIEKSYTKPYAACRYCHPAIEAAIKIGKVAEPTKIKVITVHTYDLAVGGHDHTKIQGIGSAKMSIPYGVAVGLIEGKAGLIEYDSSHVESENILSLTKRVTVKDRSEFSEKFPEVQSAEVDVLTVTGEHIVERVDFPKGEPENPMTEEEFVERFEGLMEFAEKDPEVCKKILRSCKDEINVARLCEII